MRKLHHKAKIVGSAGRLDLWLSRLPSVQGCEFESGASYLGRKHHPLILKHSLRFSPGDKLMVLGMICQWWWSVIEERAPPGLTTKFWSLIDDK